MRRKILAVFWMGAGGGTWLGEEEQFFFMDLVAGLIRSGRVRGEAGRLAMVRALLSGEAVRRIIARTDGPRHRPSFLAGLGLGMETGSCCERELPARN